MTDSKIRLVPIAPGRRSTGEWWDLVISGDEGLISKLSRCIGVLKKSSTKKPRKQGGQQQYIPNSLTNTLTDSLYLKIDQLNDWMLEANLEPKNG